MLPAELGIGYLPPALAIAVVLMETARRWWKQRDSSQQQSRKSTWDEMQDLIRELKEQRDHERRVKEAALEDNARLRHDLREALKQIHHEREDPT